MPNPFIFNKKSKITPVMQQWHHIKREYPSYIIFFRMGDFYEFFYDDAKVMAKVLDLKLTTRGTDEKNTPIPLAGIPFKALNDYLRKAIEGKYPVIVVEQSLELQKHGSKEFFGREIARIITPGTVLDPDLLLHNSNNFFASIFYLGSNNSKNSSFGLSFVDVSTGEFHISETNSKETLFNQLYRFSPAEIILSSSIDSQQFKEDIKKILPDTFISVGEEFDFNYTEALSLLKSFYNVHSLDGLGIHDSISAVTSAGAILSVLNRRNIPLIKKNPVLEFNYDYLSIDLIARRNLELEQNQRDGTLRGSLLWVFDQTQTSIGARKLRNWMRKPLKSKKEISQRLDSVEILYSNLLLREELTELLKSFPDIERLATKIHADSLNPRDTLRLNDGLKIIPHIQKVVSKEGSISTSEFLNKSIQQLETLPEITSLLDRSIRSDPPLYSNLGGIFKRGFNKDLDSLHEIKDNANKWFESFEANEQQRVNSLLRSKGKKEAKLKLSFTRGHGYYLELKSGLPVPENYTISRSLKDRTRYITPDLQEMATKILNADEEIKEKEAQLFKEAIMHPLKEKISNIQRNAEIIGTLDVLLTFATLANSYSYIKPEIIEENFIDIKNGRHPVVERIIPFGQFIANDTYLNNSDRVQIITGANMGGKSTYLRQVALIVILAHMGSYVPAESAKIGLIDRIFTRVGVVDDIWRGQSHFMVEMNETANVLNNATKNSLVILDEIGRGTSTNTGVAIASAVTEYLYSVIRCKTLFATHFHQLNNLENQFSGIKNYHVAIKYKNHELTFLHKVTKGGTDESFGLEIAQLAGFPAQVVSKASQLRSNIDAERYEEKQSSKDDSDTVKKNSSELKEQSTKKRKTSSLKNFLLPLNQQEIIKEISQRDIDNLTGLDALNLLKKWKEQLK